MALYYNLHKLDFQGFREDKLVGFRIIPKAFPGYDKNFSNGLAVCGLRCKRNITGGGTIFSMACVGVR